MTNTNDQNTRTKAIAILFASLSLTVPALVAAQSTTLHSLTVRRDSSTAYTTANADNAFNLATDGTTVDDGSSDISCQHGIVRDGSASGNNVMTFSNPASYDCTTINSDSEMTACQGRTGFVKIVEAINICGGNSSMGIIGCSPLPGNTIVLQRAFAQGGGAGALVNHEFGHATGLPHRYESGAAGADVKYIMNWQINPTSRRLNQTECTSMMTNSLDANGPGNPASGASQAGSRAPVIAVPEEEALDLSNVPIEDLARSFFADRTPIEAADYYNQDDVRTLISMLKDPANADYRQTIVALIAIISDGRESDAQTLIDVASKGPSVDPTLNSATVGLGVLANRGSRDALAFLLAHAEDSDEERADVATVGLGLSGKPEALDKLKALRKGAKGGRAVGIDETISTHAKVASRGLRGYYGR